VGDRPLDLREALQELLPLQHGERESEDPGHPPQEVPLLDGELTLSASGKNEHRGLSFLESNHGHRTNPNPGDDGVLSDAVGQRGKAVDRHLVGWETDRGDHGAVSDDGSDFGLERLRSSLDGSPRRGRFVLEA